MYFSKNGKTCIFLVVKLCLICTNEDFQLVEKLLVLVPYRKNMSGPIFFSSLVTLLKHNLSCFGEKMVGFVSDGAVHMIGKNHGTAAKLKNKVKEFVSNVFMKKHCAKCLKMNCIVDT